MLKLLLLCALTAALFGCSPGSTPVQLPAGDILTRQPYESEYKQATAEDQLATANIAVEAWGEPVRGLRVAIVLQSPPVDRNDRLCYEIVAENVSDHDIRFTAAIHFVAGFYRIGLVDSDGKHVPPQQGIRHHYADPPRLIRNWLKPNERTVISPCTTQLVQLDEVGRPIPSPTQDLASDYFDVKPGTYSVSAEVVLGQTTESIDRATGTRKVLSPAQGEWTGKLRTGVASVDLFLDAVLREAPSSEMSAESNRKG